MGVEQYNALVNRFHEQERRADRRALLVACTLINIIYNPDPPVEPDDFLEPKPKPPQTPQEQLHILKVLNTIYGGEVVTKGGSE